MRKDIFPSVGSSVPNTDTVNEAGGIAYSLTAEHELAQYAATGTFGDTFYVSGRDQFERIKNDVLPKVNSKFIAQTAVYSFEQGRMKDMPAFLCAVLASREDGLEYLKSIFPRVLNNGKMIRNFCQVIRSGSLGRRSFGYAPKRLIQKWLTEVHPHALFNAAIGNDPSVTDVIRMVHPRPQTLEQEALFGYIVKKPYRFEYLPTIVQHYENLKKGDVSTIPNIDFRYLSSLDLGPEVWKDIAKNAKWMMARMNLATFARHGVFKDSKITKKIEDQLRNPEEIANAKQFPYQLLTTYRAIENNSDIPWPIRNALQDALDISVNNVPVFTDKKIVLCPDTSGSMGSPVMDQSQRGYIKDPSILPRCIDVAGLITSAFYRSNPDAMILPFATNVYNVSLNPRDTLTTNTEKLRQLGGGGTNCSLPLAYLNQENVKADVVIYVSDYESWMDSDGRDRYGTSEMSKEWAKFRRRNPGAKLICIDCVPSRTIQSPDKSYKIMNIGGFSDFVFDLTKMFVYNELDSNHWVGLIKNIEI